MSQIFLLVQTELPFILIITMKYILEIYSLIHDDGNYIHQTISICDYSTIFTTNDYSDFIKGVYDDKSDAYNWESVDITNYYYHVFCAYYDHSLWIKDNFNYVYKYINKNRHTPLTEIPFKHIKVLSEDYAIGIDYNSKLWKYIDGTWIWIRNNVKCATVNYNGELFFLDHNINNFIYKIKTKPL
ncbi:hypothetical protein C1645_277461 [Glomus cerebriforme]|uniref:Uncharacterized protein n=1 Tax=Glomus cerebriforme TaxID=658196 RepID=A0A397TNP8_9GLOM|nr:hypothetical protein C1645_277461 [Glomus cerebriforme]